MVRKNEGTPTKDSKSNKTSDIKMMQRYLQLAELMTRSIFDKLSEMYRTPTARKIKLNKENILQAPIFALANINKLAGQEAYMEYLTMIDNATNNFSAEGWKNMVSTITHKHFLLSKVQLCFLCDC